MRYSPILYFGSRIFRCLDTYHDNCHQKKEAGQSKRHTVHGQVAHYLITFQLRIIPHDLATQPRNLNREVPVTSIGLS